MNPNLRTSFCKCSLCKQVQVYGVDLYGYAAEEKWEERVKAVIGKYLFVYPVWGFKKWCDVPRYIF